MRSVYIFIIRAILSIVFAYFASRFFFGNTRAGNVLGLAAILCGLAYLFERLRRKDGG